MEAARSIPVLLSVLRELEGECVGVTDGIEMDAGGVGELVEDVDMDTDTNTDTDTEGIEDGVMLLLVDEVAENNMVELGAACLVKDCGEGA